jgi:hypothetical protein
MIQIENILETERDGVRPTSRSACMVEAGWKSNTLWTLLAVRKHLRLGFCTQPHSVTATSGAT